jgi:hypothetical protein
MVSKRVRESVPLAILPVSADLLRLAGAFYKFS